MKRMNYRLMFRIMVITAVVAVGAAAGKAQRDHAHDGWTAPPSGSPAALAPGSGN